jgi:hypothetical protein
MSRFSSQYHGPFLCLTGFGWNDTEYVPLTTSTPLISHRERTKAYKRIAGGLRDRANVTVRFNAKVTIVHGGLSMSLFTLPSSVVKEVKTTRSGNDCIHGMTYHDRFDGVFCCKSTNHLSPAPCLSLILVSIPQAR